MGNPLQLIASETNAGNIVAASPTNPVPVTLGSGGGSSVIAVVTPLTFSRGGTFLAPSTALNIMIWYAPFNCTVTNVKGFCDVAGQVVTALHNGADLLVTDLTISTPSTWQDGGTVQNIAVVAGDTIAIQLKTVSGSPTQVSIEIVFTRP